MKTKFTLFLLIIFSFVPLVKLTAQKLNLAGGGEYKFNENHTPCLTDAQRADIKIEIKNGIQQLKLQNRLLFNETNRGGGHPLFSWPIKKKDGHEYNDVWGISNYVDQNAAFPNQVMDYNCGSRTYDTAEGYNHMGVDIFTWPFSWRMMDNDEVEIIAAAAGQIIGIARTHSDRSCAFNNNPWNAVYIQHADGSVALYGHMKQNSPTSKVLGDMVETGEYLGIVGSSGNSTGPHLHFEVYSEVELNGIGQDVLVDPYTGDCNDLNSDSWWQTQKPYNNPNINAALTHSAPPVFPTCPTTEITNESNDFAANAAAYFGIYMRDYAANTVINLKIIRPNNTALFDWNETFPNSYYASYWYWTTSFDAEGVWKWQVTYEGQTVTHNFTVGTLSVSEEDFNATTIYPNPFKNMVSISSTSTVQKATLLDVLGKTISVFNNTADGIKEIKLEGLSSGMYFLTLEGDSNQKKTIKLIKE